MSDPNTVEQHCIASPVREDERLVRILTVAIRYAVRALAVLITLLVLWAVVDVAYLIVQKLLAPPRFLMTIGDVLACFGGFLAVLIAIEIFLNITLYLRRDIIHVKLVIATALMAIARKAIVLDHEAHSPTYIIALGVLMLALAVGYWLVSHAGPWRLAKALASEDTPASAPGRAAATTAAAGSGDGAGHGASR